MKSNGFDEAISLAVNGPKGNFEEYVWRSLTAFSKSLSAFDLEDRIAFRVAAIESMLLKDGSEPIAAAVGDRIAFLLSSNSESRLEIVKSFKAVYKIRSDYVHHRKSPIEKEELVTFSEIAWATMMTLVSNLGRFRTREDFLESIDNLKYGS